jgi:two-component system, OmpR family, KDP operon response regulator KdpE
VAHLLLIEDDSAIRTTLLRALRERGHAVAASHTAMDGLQTALAERPDLIVLDLGLPDLDGRELLRMLRAVSAVPVIVATARDDETEIVRVLDAGADDYIVKPFSAGQLDARIRAVLRRTGEQPKIKPVQVGQLTIDATTRVAILANRSLDLSKKEFDLLHYLASRPGEVVSKQELLATVWEQPLGGADKTVDVHLSWLRRKLGETASKPRYLRTVRGVGIKLVDPFRGYRDGGPAVR